MEKIDGVTLDYALRSQCLSMVDLMSIARQLKDIVTQLRTLGTASGHRKCGSWPSGTYKHHFFQGLCPRAPDEMATVSEFLGYWVSVFQHDPWIRDPTSIHGPSDLLVSLQNSVTRYQHHEPALCHGDFSPNNILVKDGKVVAILDWEMLGWYPEFWEPMMFCKRFIPKEIVKEIFGELDVIATLFRIGMFILFDPSLGRP